MNSRGVNSRVVDGTVRKLSSRYGSLTPILARGVAKVLCQNGGAKNISDLAVHVFAYYFLEGVPKKIIRRESGIGKRGIRDLTELTEHLMLDEVLHKQQADGLLGGYGRVACVDAT